MCGGYRKLFSLSVLSTACFPCVRGLSDYPGVFVIHGLVFPLCAGVIDRRLRLAMAKMRVSPAWGLSAVGERAGSGGLVFPLRAGVIGYLIFQFVVI